MTRANFTQQDKTYLNLTGCLQLLDTYWNLKNPPGNLLEFIRSSWKFLCKMLMIDCIGFQSKLDTRSLI